jgi:hypothetical protein
MLVGRYEKPSTYVLSLACFKLSRNFKPAIVVDSTVSDLEGVSACMEAVPCQHCSHDCLSRIPPSLTASPARA